MTLDVLRGFALWGVLVSNLFALYSFRWAKQHQLPETTYDAIAEVAIGIVIAGKAQNLLTFLFGFGFATILVRATERGQPAAGLYARRLAALFLIGVLHMALLWWGDVTWGYAICGFALLLFMKAPNWLRLTIGVILTLAPFIVWVLLKGGRIALLFMDMQDNKRYLDALVSATKDTDYPEIILNHVRYSLVFQAPIFIWYFPSLVGRFLLGYVAGAQRWFDREGADHLPLFRKLAAGSLVIGAAAATLRTLQRQDLIALPIPKVLGPTLYTLETVGLATLYLAGIVLLMQGRRWRRVLSVLAPAGRMPLTTYVSQSVFCTLLFYGWGFELDTPGPLACLAIGTGIFAVQVVIAHFWLKRYRFGPLEWVWRTIAYLRRPEMRVR